jgi:YgiT-type zinc finger domain-containing protein
MTGAPANPNPCPLCGGRLKKGVATIPFVLDNTVVLIKGVPAEICRSCHEPYTTGKVTNRLTSLLNQMRALQTEVSVIAYSKPQPALV